MIIKFVDTPSFVKDFAVVAKPVGLCVSGYEWCRVQGKQLKLALKRESDAQFYHGRSWYYFRNTEFETEWRRV